MLNVIYEFAKDALRLGRDAKQAAKQREVVVECLRMECQINLDLIGLIKKEKSADPDYLDVIRELRCEVLGAVLATVDTAKILKKKKKDRDRAVKSDGVLEEESAVEGKTDYEVADFIFRKMATLKAFANFKQSGEALKNIRVKQRLLHLKCEIVELDKRMRAKALPQS